MFSLNDDQYIFIDADNDDYKIECDGIVYDNFSQLYDPSIRKYYNRLHGFAGISFCDDCNHTLTFDFTKCGMVKMFACKVSQMSDVLALDPEFKGSSCVVKIQYEPNNKYSIELVKSIEEQITVERELELSLTDANEELAQELNNLKERIAALKLERDDYVAEIETLENEFAIVNDEYNRFKDAHKKVEIIEKLNEVKSDTNKTITYLAKLFEISEDDPDAVIQSCNMVANIAQSYEPLKQPLKEYYDELNKLVEFEEMLKNGLNEQTAKRFNEIAIIRKKANE